MQEMLQFSPEKRIGDWFLLEKGTMIRLYGFVYQPYILPAFLNPSVLAPDLTRHNIIVENEQFLSFKKSSTIKFQWVVGPFIIKKGFLTHGGKYIKINEVLDRYCC